MHQERFIGMSLLGFFLCYCMVTAETLSLADRDLSAGRFAGNGIVIGLEYAVLNHEALVKETASVLSETGMTGMKHFAEAVQWGAMQKGPNAPIDFHVLDWFVREYQAQGFTELTLCLKPHSVWASKNVPLLGKHTNASPKSEYCQLFQNWIASVVERYDGDGKNDMPGLRWPIHYIEIGSEFSSYEPEPVDDYLDTLRMAYEAAHRASDQIKVGHAAFLFVPVNLDVQNPADYDRAWAAADIRDKHHGLKDQRAILDQPEIFDFINIHNLGDPYEIEHIMKWLRYETSKRKYTKPVVISDTIPTSYIGYGPATTCKGKNLGVISSPAKEPDRCRLAKFFQKLVNKDRDTLAWTRGFVASDEVKRAVIAAEQGVKLINLSFTGDLPVATLPVFKAAAGISAWGGAIRVNYMTGNALEKYPLFYAIRQLMDHFNAYDSIERVGIKDDRACVYLVHRKGKQFWIAWFNPKTALLPEDGEPGINITLDIGVSKIVIEPVITEMGQTAPKRRKKSSSNEKINIFITPAPIYILPE